MAESGTNIYVIIGFNCINYFTNTDVVKMSIGHKILENMVIGFVAYTPPLAYPFVIRLPHLSVIYLPNKAGLSVVNYIPNIYSPVYNGGYVTVALIVAVVRGVVVNTLSYYTIPNNIFIYYYKDFTCIISIVCYTINSVI